MQQSLEGSGIRTFSDLRWERKDLNAKFGLGTAYGILPAGRMRGLWTVALL